MDSKGASTVLWANQAPFPDLTVNVRGTAFAHLFSSPASGVTLQNKENNEKGSEIPQVRSRAVESEASSSVGSKVARALRPQQSWFSQLTVGFCQL